MPLASASAAGRLKREDWPRTKHDSLFSPWKVLVGPSDWEDHSAGKEGVQRYRTLNLPENFPGLYELGVARASDEGVRARRHGLGVVVVVYLGQADNVRARLQQYGRTGSHLDTWNPLASAGKAEANALTGATGPGLFREVFSRGYSLMFRCALMGNKQEAERTEVQLLRVFDYAWNKLQNGAGRREEILLKLEHGSSLLKRVQHFKQKIFLERAGIKITRSGSVDNSSGNAGIMKDMLPRVRAFVGFRPRLVNFGDSVDEGIDIHRKNTSKGNTCVDKRAHGRMSKGCKVKKIDVTKQRTVLIRDSNSVCGVMLEGGSSCLEPPVHGRKRCELHKGKRVAGNPVSSSSYTCKVEIPTAEPIPRITEDASKSETDQVQQIVIILSENLSATMKESSRQRNSCGAKEVKIVEAPTEDITYGTSVDADACGVKIIDSPVCNDKVMLGSKRSQLHDGLKESQSASSGLIHSLQNNVKLHSNSETNDQLCREKNSHAESQSQGKQPSGRVWFELLKSQKSASLLSSRGRRYQTRVTDDVANICGVVMDNGYCKMVPLAGGKRCEELKGIKVTDASSVPFSRSSGWPSICGARASDGLPCKNQPVAGRKRCALHKGQRSCSAPPPSIE